MKLLSLLISAGLAIAQSSTSISMDMSGSMSTMSMSAAASTSTSPEYTITALLAVESVPSCIFNCLIPIGLADPSGCDDVTEDCACLSAPADVLDFLTDCVNTVCQSSNSAFGASATSLYESYCTSVYGNATFAQAFVAESSADAVAAASSSIASVEASMTSSSSSSSSSRTATGSSASASAIKSDSNVRSPTLLTAGMIAIGGLAILAVL